MVSEKEREGECRITEVMNPIYNHVIFPQGLFEGVTGVISQPIKGEHSRLVLTPSKPSVCICTTCLCFS